MRGRLALGFPHRLQDARLGDPAEIVVDGGLPPRLNHVEADGTCQGVGLVQSRANTVGGNTALIAAARRLVESVDRK